MRRIIPFLLLSIAACGGPSAPEDQGGGAVIVDRHPASQRSAGWLEFKDLSGHMATEERKPIEPYVLGEWVGGHFDATGEIIGNVGSPPRGRNVSRGWLDLRTRAFYPTSSSRPRTTPFIDGFRDDDTGGFYPLSNVSWKAP